MKKTFTLALLVYCMVIACHCQPEILFEQVNAHSGSIIDASMSSDHHLDIDETADSRLVVNGKVFSAGTDSMFKVWNSTDNTVLFSLNTGSTINNMKYFASPMGPQYDEVYLALMNGTYLVYETENYTCLLYTSPSPRDLSTSRMPSSA